MIELITKRIYVIFLLILFCLPYFKFMIEESKKEEFPPVVLPEDPKYIEWMGMKKNVLFQMKFADKNLKFSFLYNPKRLRCATDTVFIGVVTAPESFKLRKWVRNTWSRNTPPNYLIHFFIGKSVNAKTNEDVKKEAEKHDDTVLVDFMDSYKSLSIKLFTMMTWKENYCDEAMYFLRTNDDSIINYANLQHFIKQNYENANKPFIYGYVFQKPAVAHMPASKWCVTWDEYNESYYPDFCAGWCCIYTRSAVNAILKQTPLTKFLWLDDALFSGILAEKANVPRVNLTGLFIPEFGEKDYRNFICKFKPSQKFIAVHFHDLSTFLEKKHEK